ncbi:DJ-1-like protein [Rhizoclosmatium globosum]|uniref:D-lactate dehydratase n=1 Tax=Rhizoclosmatium globosum TaxID=329046 RepID=A0A1Y2CIM7_9FUNG|nr:DJ-1-like protein [Rhizoclosmatium globosum]|eukprot:ORY46879.1 DJ-1-like protein [Rhizoclosmatium globosum]
MVRVLVVVADGSEEMETVICVDVLRRAQIEVTLASVGAQVVTCSRNVRLHADAQLNLSDSDFDAVVLPGGLGGAKAFAENAALHTLLKAFESKGKLVAAVCAAPIALHPANIAKGKQITSHPSVKDQLVAANWFGEYKEDRVVVDGNLITSRGPGTSFEFALSIIKYLCGKEKAEEVAGPMVLPPGTIIV